MADRASQLFVCVLLMPIWVEISSLFVTYSHSSKFLPRNFPPFIPCPAQTAETKNKNKRNIPCRFGAIRLWLVIPKEVGGLASILLRTTVDLTSLKKIDSKPHRTDAIWYKWAGWPKRRYKEVFVLQNLPKKKPDIID